MSDSPGLLPAFYVTGGTLPPDAPSYVARQADAELLAALRRGDYCYVLNARQMGKSSLCVRTLGRLHQEGYHTAFLDLTRFGGRNLTAEQWYAALLSELGRDLGLRVQPGRGAGGERLLERAGDAVERGERGVPGYPVSPRGWLVLLLPDGLCRTQGAVAERFWYASGLCRIEADELAEAWPEFRLPDGWRLDGRTD